MSVRLDRIVTRGGDGGMTSLGDGERVRKDDPLIEAMGALDELNAVIGLVRLSGAYGTELARIQNILFDIGAILCIPERNIHADAIEEDLLWLEDQIEQLRDRQEPLKSFVLPGGCSEASWAHMARTTARRAERRLVMLDQPRLTGGMAFLNRLSDYFFVLARHFNGDGKDDILWRPRGA
ncbi:cob(I)yrinic acid a,c-diamide adenosyltransferase [Asaia sp. As-1742]|uniref:cob(I)yrinic acid a,c-diamide adenosyltransferase n=1 Tax=Asaia sp. As-1742 TaxID=2608325 RepID=UPI0014244179|nr:cob(I)yrinic acid a,c-diamide adenosyltransferase [Asaia sp. As-1742]NIE79639.1 cob(I)yrinic acid a,c-diamide adenosyltransferase [Asaia sp. As-1742]